MALFVYYWKSGKNERHEGEIDAPDRESAFAMLRERGIRAIKVEPKGWETGKGYKGVKKRVVAGVAVAAALLAGGTAFFAGRVSDLPDTVITEHGPVTFSSAMPLTRQQIPGDRARLENLPTNLFAFASEFLLAKFAEPGRPVDFEKLVFPEDSDFIEAIKRPVRIASNDFTEFVDLKRIVTGMKRELRTYLKAGGSVEEYRLELIKRQQYEIAFREKAEKNLEELISRKDKPNFPPGAGYQAKVSAYRTECLKAAYDYWLKANAALQASGIYQLSLPDELRNFQTDLNID